MRSPFVIEAMTPLLAMLLVAPAELPTLAELDRFPGLDACHARLRVLIEQRHQQRLTPATPDRDNALRLNTHRLAAWEALHEARGGLAEEGVEGDRAAAWERLRTILGDADWKAGRMP
jgi:hypothetical protein